MGSENKSTPSTAPNTDGAASWTAPRYWANDSKSLNADYFWGRADSVGQKVAKAHGLSSPTPVMCSTQKSGDYWYMFESAGTYYVWSRIDNDVWRVAEPKKLDEIVAKIKASEMRELKLELVPEVETLD